MGNKILLFIWIPLVLIATSLYINAQEINVTQQNRITAKPLPPAPLNPPLINGPEKQVNAPPIKKVSPGILEMGGVYIFKKLGKVEFPATVNMSEGLLEYLIVGDTGKLHESLLKTDIEPYSLQIALLMIGLEGSSNPLKEQGDPQKPEGDPVKIWVSYKKGPKIEKLRIENWVVLREGGKPIPGGEKPMNPIEWVFTGSIIRDGIFMAQIEKSFVALFHDPSAMIDNPMTEGANDEIWFVNNTKAPQVGTDVTVIIEKVLK